MAVRNATFDLTEAWKRATKLGLKPKDERSEVLIDMLAPYHLKHRFRYRQTGWVSVPVLNEALDITSNLIGQIGPEVDKAMRAEIAAKKATTAKK